MAITHFQSVEIRRLWNMDLDTFDIAKELNLKESEVYAYVGRYVERKAKCQVGSLVFGASKSKTAKSSVSPASV
jgi:hypothetical protein